MSLFDKIKILYEGVNEEVAATTGKLYALAPNNDSADAVVTRALDTATRVNSAGNIETVVANKARIDYSLGTDKCPNLLVERSVVNLLQWSEQFDNAVWAKTNSTVDVNAANSPFNTLTADRLVDNVTSGLHSLTYSAVGSSGTNAFSFFAKADTLSRIGVFTNSGVNVNLASTPQVFDLSNGTVVNSVTGIEARIHLITNGWYRCVLTIPSSGAGNYLIVLVSAGTTTTYAGSGQGLFIWGAQLQTGVLATSYIPTVGATATKNADVIQKTGLSALIPQTKGTLLFDGYLQAGSLSDSETRYVLQVSNGTNQERYFIWRFNNTLRFEATVANVNNPVITTTIFNPLRNKRLKIMYAYEAGNYNVYINGALIITSTNPLIPTSLSRIDIANSLGVNNNQWDGLIKMIGVADELTATERDQFFEYDSLEIMAGEMQYVWED